jgi:hypothetical protein
MIIYRGKQRELVWPTPPEVEAIQERIKEVGALGVLAAELEGIHMQPEVFSALYALQGLYRFYTSAEPLGLPPHKLVAIITKHLRHQIIEVLRAIVSKSKNWDERDADRVAYALHTLVITGGTEAEIPHRLDHFYQVTTLQQEKRWLLDDLVAAAKGEELPPVARERGCIEQVYRYVKRSPTSVPGGATHEELVALLHSAYHRIMQVRGTVERGGWL